MLTLLFRQTLLSENTEDFLKKIKEYLPKEENLKDSNHAFFSLLNNQAKIQSIYGIISNKIQDIKQHIRITIPDKTECKNNLSLFKQLIIMHKALTAILITEQEITNNAQASQKLNIETILQNINLKTMEINSEFLQTFQILQKQEINNLTHKDQTDKNKTLKQISAIVLTTIACGILLYFIAIKEKNQLKEDEHHYYRIKVKTNLNQEN